MDGRAASSPCLAFLARCGGSPCLPCGHQLCLCSARSQSSSRSAGQGSSDMAADPHLAASPCPPASTTSLWLTVSPAGPAQSLEAAEFLPHPGRWPSPSAAGGSPWLGATSRAGCFSLKVSVTSLLLLPRWPQGGSSLPAGSLGATFQQQGRDRASGAVRRGSGARSGAGGCYRGPNSFLFLFKPVSFVIRRNKIIFLKS